MVAFFPSSLLFIRRVGLVNTNVLKPDMASGRVESKNSSTVAYKAVGTPLRSRNNTYTHTHTHTSPASQVR